MNLDLADLKGKVGLTHHLICLYFKEDSLLVIYYNKILKK